MVERDLAPQGLSMISVYPPPARRVLAFRTLFLNLRRATRRGRIPLVFTAVGYLSGIIACISCVAGYDGVSEAAVDPTPLDLGSIVVTSKRAPIGSSESSEQLEIVTGERIHYLPANNFSDVLLPVPGVDVQPRQGFGRATSLSIQGSDSRQVRVMVDGILFNSQSSGQVNPAQFPFENIERVEVIKGAGSSVWGSGLGGVVNIITKDTGTTTQPKGTLTTSFAEFRTMKETGEFSGKAGGLGYYFLADYMDSKGAHVKNDVLDKKMFSKLSYDLREQGKITALFGYSAADVNSGIFPDASWQAQPYQSRYGKVGWEKDYGFADVTVELKQNRQNIITRSFLAETDIEPYSIVRTAEVSYQASVNASIPLRQHDLLIVGVDRDWDILKSDPYLSKAKQLRLYAPYAQYLLKYGQWDFNAGLRYDCNSEFGTALSPSWGVVYHVNDRRNTLLRGSVSRAFTAPPLLWKFNANDLLLVAPNPDIRPEFALVYQAGIEMNVFPSLWVGLSGYRAEVTDALNWAETDSGLWYMKNFEKFRRQGAALECRQKLTSYLSFVGGAAFNDIEDLSTRTTVRGGGKPRQSFKTGFELKNTRGFSVTLNGRYDRWNESPSVNPNDRKMLADMKVMQEFRRYAVFLTIYNLMNSKYWADDFFPVPRRYFEGGFRVQW